MSRYPGRCAIGALWLGCLLAVSAPAATLTTAGDRFQLDGVPIKLWGVRTASASQSAEGTRHLVSQLDDYRSHGLNAVAVFYQGSSGGYSNPFSPDGTAIDPAHQARMVEIIEACDRRGMVVVVGIFYQRAEFLRTPTAWTEAVRTVARLLRPHRNVIINLANEQNSSLYRDSNPIFDLGDPARLIELCDVVHAEDPQRLVGAGGYDHAKNIVLGRARSVDVLLFDTNGPEDSGALFDRFVAAGVTGKPIVNVEQFGAYSGKAEFPKTAGVYTESNRALFRREVDAARSRPGLSTFFFDQRWLQGGGTGGANRYDLGGDGTEASPGFRWYAAHVRDAAGATPAARQ
jgi:sugar phosphate isomerase/epimerase